MSYSSETASARDRLAPYCAGNGLDIGFGGDPIVPWAICLDRKPGDEMRAVCGEAQTQWRGDAADLSWLSDNALDFAYSSHALEDFTDTRSVLKEWTRVVKVGGVVVLFLPDEQTYRAHCKATGQPYNLAHIHDNMGLPYMKAVAASLGNLAPVHALFPVPNNAYSFDLVLRKTH